MADIHFQCVNCGQHLEVEQDAGGMSVECPSCNQQITIPSPPPPEPVPDESKLGIKGQGNSPTAHEPAASAQDEALEEPSSVNSVSQGIHSATCSNCGAQMDIDCDASMATCLFCGSKRLIDTPQDRLNPLRDFENQSLGVTHCTPALSFDQAREAIVERIKADECGLRNAEQLQMEVKGFYHPAWKIDVTGLACWTGKNSREESFTNYRTVYVRVGDQTVERKEPFVDHKTVWDGVSGQQFFNLTLLFPAAEGISIVQFEAVSDGADGQEHSGHPEPSRNFMVIPATKPQSRIWNEYDCNSRVQSYGEVSCLGCAERLVDVSSAIQSREFSLTYIPVAVVTYTANETEYRHFVNLQTGQFSGDVPLDLSKVADEAARSEKEDKELRLSRILAWSVLGAYIFVTCIVNMAWRNWDPVQAAISSAIQPFLAIFGENLEKDDLLAGSVFLSLFFSWVGWLAAYGVYRLLVPSGSPWSSFLERRQAFLIRLILSPPKHISQLAHYNDPRMEEVHKSLKTLADDNDLERLPFPGAKAITEPVGKILVSIAHPATTTPRFIRSTIAIGCGCIALIIGAIGYSNAVTGIRRAAMRVRLEREKQEQLAREEKAREERAVKAQQAREESAAKALQAREEAERQRREGLARQMLSSRRWNENAFGASYLPPLGWRRTRSEVESMSSWFGSGYPFRPNMSVRFIRNDVSSLTQAAENGMSTALEAYSEEGERAKSLGTVEFKTAGGKPGIRLLVDAVTRGESLRVAFYYIDNGQTLFVGICTARTSAWDSLAPMFDVCMQSVQFMQVTSTTYDPYDTTPEVNADMTDRDALFAIGLTYYYDGNLRKAVDFFKKAADRGNVVAQYNVGACYMDGIGVEQNATEAVKWYKLSGQNGYATAQVKLGLCYLRGVGVNKSLEAAEECFRLAAQQGDSDGATLLREVRSDLAVQRRAQQALAAEQEANAARQAQQERNSRNSSQTPATFQRSNRSSSVRRIGETDSRIRRIGEDDSRIRRIGE